MDIPNLEPMVSIIVPTYNRAHYIDFTIRSALGQTYENIELIVIDDGSTDDTRTIVSPYLEYHNFIYCEQENRGQSVARNKGLSLASGEFICFLDSDDVLVSDAIEVLVKYIMHYSDVSVVYGNLDFIDGDGNYVPGINPRRYSGTITSQLLIDNCVSFDSVLIRRSCLEMVGGLDERVDVGDDYDLWLRVSVGHKFLYVPKVFGQYRIMHQQISTDIDRRFKSNKSCLERFFEDNPGLQESTEKNYFWCRFYTRFGSNYAYRGNLRKAFRFYFKAISFKFFSIYPWRALLKLIIYYRNLK